MAVGPMENGSYGEHLSISGYGNCHIQYSSVLVGAANGTRGADEASMFQLIKSNPLHTLILICMMDVREQQFT